MPTFSGQHEGRVEGHARLFQPGGAATPVFIVRRADEHLAALRVRFHDKHDAVWRRARKGAQHDGVKDAIHQGRRADPERQHHDSNKREGRRRLQSANGVAEIEAKRVHRPLRHPKCTRQCTGCAAPSLSAGTNDTDLWTADEPLDS